MHVQHAEERAYYALERMCEDDRKYYWMICNQKIARRELDVSGSQHNPSIREKRLVRFLFPNVYPLNHRFERKMLGDDMLGAFLSLLIDRYVLEDEVAEKLALSSEEVGALIQREEEDFATEVEV